ncbi:MAG: hypothetical protein HYU05_02030 [Candidatus Wildermuthbacteria bacterium]|nr:hypothetical protein [Candidatus Wildermuthbacteria bacterium]MBI2121455.1 hypothetical protein [Candidatus Wildermuthbacteria bacterium]MBI2647744.1 hypothetical protein [Candidatus Wildermuthbacteria bacterium]
MAELTKAIIPLTDPGGRFAPLSKVIPPALFPLATLPFLHYILEELRGAGITSALLVAHPTHKELLSRYIQEDPAAERELATGHEQETAQALQNLRALLEEMNISVVADKHQSGGHALAQGRKFAGEDAFLVALPEYSFATPSHTAQLVQAFKTSQHPILGLAEVRREQAKESNVVTCEKIAARLHKIKEIHENPLLRQQASALITTGRMIFTSDFFEYQKKSSLNLKEENTIAKVIHEMLKDGKLLYGYECAGRRFMCANQQEWLYANIEASLAHGEYGPMIKKFIAEEHRL